MCLIHRCTREELDKGTGMPIPKVATQDISVFKLLIRKERDVYDALFHGGTYEKGYHYYQVPDKFTDKNGFSVKEDQPNKKALIPTFRICIGLHSYREKPKRSPYPLSKPNLEYVEMFIPEGALYYEGDNGVDLVSNELIYADKDKMPYEEWDDEEQGFIEVPPVKKPAPAFKGAIVPSTTKQKWNGSSKAKPTKKVAAKGKSIKAVATKKQVNSPKKPIKKAAIKKVAKPAKKKAKR